MISNNTSNTFRVVVLGAVSSGKTSIIRRLLFDSFSSDTSPTLGAVLSTYMTTINGKIVKMNIWDTAGQEYYKSISKFYYRDANAAIIVFDVGSLVSFQDIDYWLNELEESVSGKLLIIVVGNKIDLFETREVEKTVGMAYSTGVEVEYMETSAKTGEGIAELFQEIAKHFALLNDKKQETQETQKKEHCCS